MWILASPASENWGGGGVSGEPTQTEKINGSNRSTWFEMIGSYFKANAAVTKN